MIPRLRQVIAVPDEELYYPSVPHYYDSSSDSDRGFEYDNVDDWVDLDDFDFNGSGDKRRGKRAAISYAQAVKSQAG